MFEEITNIKIMLEKGFVTTPMLEVDGQVMDFKEAVDWVNSQE